MTSYIALLAASALLATETPPGTQSNDGRLLIRNVAVSSQSVVFSYAGDLWRVGREGGVAEQLTSGPADDDYPTFSPDGLNIAFSRRGADDWDVYIVPAQGGEPRRMTYHPEADIARTWNATGDTVIFMSHRDEKYVFRLYAISREGGFTSALALPRAWDASVSSEGGRVAYVPFAWPGELFGAEWLHYRGGMNAGISIVRLAGGDIVNIPRDGANDRDPGWIGSVLYFVSDRSGTFNLHSYDPRTRQVEQHTSHERYGVESASAGAGVLAYVQDGGIKVFIPATGLVDTLQIQVEPDLSERATRSVAGGRFVQTGSPSPAGDRVVFGMRGELVAYDVATGEYSNLTNTSGAAERDAIVSPDGQRIAYFTDETGKYQLIVRPVSGDGQIINIPVELRPSFYRELTWSPDSKHLAFSDKELTLWVADVETGGARKVTTSTHSYQDFYQPAWSPDGVWLAYTRYESNRIRTVYLYHAERGRRVQLTDGRVDSEHPVFDATGRYLYFVASNTAPIGDFNWSVLSGTLLRPYVTRTLQLVVLREGLAAPVYPLVGEPNPAADSLAAPPEVAPPENRRGPEGRPPPGRGVPGEQLPEGGMTAITLRDIGDRIVPLPLPPKDFAGLAPGDRGVLFVLLNEWPDAPGAVESATQTLYRYDLSEPQELFRLVENVDEFAITVDHSKILYRRGSDWALVPAREASGSETGRLDLSAIELEIDPAAEWQQLYHESWRLMEDYFYDPEHHGQNLDELEQHYATYLPSIVRRQDLNLLLAKGLGTVSVSNLRVSGGDLAPPPESPGSVGLLGADYVIDRDHYRIRRIYRSGNHSYADPLISGPLDQPGVYVREGDYLVAVDGKPVSTNRNLHSYFLGSALKPTRITVSSDVREGARRTYTVVPLPSEGALRRWDWAERNRRIVAEESQGILGYIYVQDFASAGLEATFQQLLENTDKRGLIIDQRFSVGGITADFLFDLLQRAPVYYYAFRHGDNLAVPPNPLPGAKVLLINDVNDSAAETFALMFKLGNAGKIVGTRTAGGGVELYSPVPRLIDGGEIGVPSRAAFNPAGSWDITNQGVQPDIEVPLTAADWWEGRDPQLGTAIRTVLQMIVDNPPFEVTKPEYPVYPQPQEEQ
jgi:tricorn protease